MKNIQSRDQFYSIDDVEELLSRWNSNYGLELKDRLISNKFTSLDTDFRSINLEGETITNLGLLERSFQKAIFRNSRLVNVFFRKAKLISSRLEGARVIDTVFQGADLKYANLSDTVFIRCDFTRAKLQGATLNNASFIDCDLTNTSFELDDDEVPTRLMGIVFNNCKLWGTRFNGAVLRGCEFIECHLYQLQTDNWDLKDIVSEGVYYGPERAQEFYQPFDSKLSFVDYFRARSSFTKWVDIPTNIRTATVQYLQYFKDYMEHTRGLSLSVEHLFRGEKTGIVISSLDVEALKNIESHLRDYIGYVTGDKEVPIDHVDPQKRLAYKQLELEVFTLKNRVETQQIVLDDYRNIINNALLPRGHTFNIDASSYSNSDSTSNSNSSIKARLTAKKELDVLSEKYVNAPQVVAFIDLLKQVMDGRSVDIRPALKDLEEKPEEGKECLQHIVNLGENVVIGAMGSGTWELIKATLSLLFP